ncbi:nSTAND1 domain-containing NTPase [Nostoc sp.]|uniref:nSTAND1 domain-containing NTPase n=1 Tax=Nostoc sp. TaxID=1180 RepID=UPI002FF58419
MQQEQQEKLLILNTVFTPSAPITTKDLFFGRIFYVNKVIDAIIEKGQHAVLYGERGVGKTSLANIINQILDSNSINISKVTCNRTEDFGEIWIKALKRIFINLKSREGIGFIKQESHESFSIDKFLPTGKEVKPGDVINLLEQLQFNTLFIFDEFDNVGDSKIQAKFADTIKALSDSVPQVTILVVGIADSVNDLIGNHPSLERCLKQIKLPVMPDEELQKIIDNGLEKLGMSVESDVR